MAWLTLILGIFAGAGFMGMLAETDNLWGALVVGFVFGMVGAVIASQENREREKLEREVEFYKKMSEDKLKEVMGDE